MSFEINNPIPLENRAWKGIRAYINQSVAYKYPFNIELEFHHGRNQYMITIYDYELSSIGNRDRLSKDIMYHHYKLFDDIIDALRYAEKYLGEKYNRNITFGKVPKASGE